MDTTTERSFEERFAEHAEKWERETGFLSSISQIQSHRSYRAVEDMVTEDRDGLIKLLLCDMRDNRRHWFGLLARVTGCCPFGREDSGYVDKMIAAWMRWGKQNGYIGNYILSAYGRRWQRVASRGKRCVSP